MSGSSDAFPSGRRALRAGLPWFFTVATGSMKPILWPGSTVEVRPCPPSGARIGEVLCVRVDGELLVHRLVAWADVDGERAVITRGDRCPDADPPRPWSDVLGRVCSVRCGRLSWRIDGVLTAPLSRVASRLWPLTAPVRVATRPVRRAVSARADVPAPGTELQA